MNKLKNQIVSGLKLTNGDVDSKQFKTFVEKIDRLFACCGSFLENLENFPINTGNRIKTDTKTLLDIK